MRFAHHTLPWAILGGLCLLMVSCQEAQTPASEEKTPTEETTQETVALSDEMMRAIQPELGSLVTQTVSEVIKANGRVDLPPENRATVSVPLNGKIGRVHILPGQAVRKGEMLATLQSFEAIQLQQDYLQAQSKMTLLEKELERQRTLGSENVGARRNLEQAEYDHATTATLLQSLSAKLALIGIQTASLSQGGVASAVRILSPVTGFVTVSNVNLGKEVKAGDVLFEVIDKKHQHIEITVFEQDAPKIKKGQPVRVELPNGNTPPLDAYVYLVGQALESEARSLNIHAHVRDSKQEATLLPGTFVAAYISTQARQAMTLPEEAIIHKGSANYIYVQEGSPNTFRRVAVQVGGKADNGNLEVVSKEPLSSRRIVIKGAFLLDTELSKRNEPEED